MCSSTKRGGTFHDAPAGKWTIKGLIFSLYYLLFPKMCNSNAPPLDTQQQIGHTHLTVGWLLDVVGKECAEFQQLEKTSDVLTVSTSQIGQKQGHNSTIYLLQVTFKNGQSVGYCLKTPSIDPNGPLGGGLRRLVSSDHNVRVHNRECLFYRNFRSLPGLKIPRIFSLQELISEDDKEGHILMEYLGYQSSILPLSSSYTPKQLFAVVDQLAYLHAYSHVNRPKLEATFPSMFLARKKDLERIKVFEEHHKEVTKRLEETGGADIASLLDELGQKADRFRFGYYANEKVYKEHGLPSVLSQNDLWGNNIIFQFNENGPTDQLVAIIDWQLAGYSNPCNDLARLLIMNVETESRRSLLPSLLQHYCLQFHSNLKAMDCDGELFGVEQLRSVFDASFVTQIHFATFIGTVNFAHSQANPKERNDYYRRMRSALVDALRLFDENKDKWVF